MKLTTQTDYAVRTLMFLATRSSRVNVADISQLFGISVNRVGKVVNLLAREGYIRSTRGVGCGIASSTAWIRRSDSRQDFRDSHTVATVARRWTTLWRA